MDFKQSGDTDNGMRRTEWDPRVSTAEFSHEGKHVRCSCGRGGVGGRGIAAQLVEAAYAYAENKGLAFKASCSYAAAWLKRRNG